MKNEYRQPSYNLNGGDKITALYCRFPRDDEPQGYSNSIINQKICFKNTLMIMVLETQNSL